MATIYDAKYNFRCTHTEYAYMLRNKMTFLQSQLCDSLQQQQHGTIASGLPPQLLQIYSTTKAQQVMKTKNFSVGCTIENDQSTIFSFDYSDTKDCLEFLKAIQIKTKLRNEGKLRALCTQEQEKRNAQIKAQQQLENVNIAVTTPTKKNSAEMEDSQSTTVIMMQDSPMLIVAASPESGDLRLAPKTVTRADALDSAKLNDDISKNLMAYQQQEPEWFSQFRQDMDNKWQNLMQILANPQVVYHVNK